MRVAGGGQGMLKGMLSQSLLQGIGEVWASPYRAPRVLEPGREGGPASDDLVGRAGGYGWVRSARHILSTRPW